MKKDIISKRKGFTIIELVVVIVVIAILSTITGIALIVVPQRAQDTTAEAAAKNTKDLVDLYRTVNSTYPSAQVALDDFGDYAPENFPDRLTFITNTDDPIRDADTTKLKYCQVTATGETSPTGYIIEYYAGSAKTKRGGDTTGYDDCGSTTGIQLFPTQ